MSALTRLESFVHIGGQLFRGPGQRAAGGGGPRCRQLPQLTRSQVIQAEFFNAVLGHFPYPDPSQWMDEELGILPGDED
ncbi:unnamed protein product [Nyctereutes procyonoides]|uniref:NADH dehydrogenase [ubiquinone] 1 beta subcomplex subunit 2, mitochondrial n=1 Tax=Nyctereutes procyonoides TaxID=34880 RepID=A0A811Z7S9_NYCPR|nr:unnamed protein product [Nyctereutes procyonoides]